MKGKELLKIIKELEKYKTKEDWNDSEYGTVLVSKGSILIAPDFWEKMRNKWIEAKLK